MTAWRDWRCGRIPGGRLPADVIIEDEHIVEVPRAPAGSADERVDAAGGLLLPAYIDTHVHLDKVLIRDQLAEHDGTLAGAIEAIHAAKRDYTVEDVRRRARAVIESSVLTGTPGCARTSTSTRSAAWCRCEGVLAAARDCADIAEVQVIAFPQEGMLRDPGAADLMAEAMERGATVVGGMPHWEAGRGRRSASTCGSASTWRRRTTPTSTCTSTRPTTASVRTLAMVVDETERRGWQGRVTVGHVCALAAADDEYADAGGRRLRPARGSRWCRTRSPTWCSRAGATADWSGAGPPGSASCWPPGCRGGVRAGLRGGRLLPLRPRRHAGGGAGLGARRAPHHRGASSSRRWPRVTTVPAARLAARARYGVRPRPAPTCSSTPPTPGPRCCGCRTRHDRSGSAAARSRARRSPASCCAERRRAPAAVTASRD